MEAKDTVRNFDNTLLSTFNSLIETQAEISFKAGYAKLKSEYDEDMREHRLSGRKEVGEWVDANMWKQGSIERWKAFKKSVGL
ncbi:hypothetical protein LCGC14_2438650 [marine sediment metagenome]|uniref:Uncharacterized protein n=1 Tax=marine sediment metagenome TaxID=412755 RepID=A0A0F9EDL5_9ZZZZ